MSRSNLENLKEMVTQYQIGDGIIDRKNLIHVGMLSGLAPTELLKIEAALPKSQFTQDEALRILNSLPRANVPAEKIPTALKIVFKNQEAVTVEEFEELAVNVIGLPASAIQLVKDKVPLDGEGKLTIESMAQFLTICEKCTRP